MFEKETIFMNRLPVFTDIRKKKKKYVCTQKNILYFNKSTEIYLFS